MTAGDIGQALGAALALVLLVGVIAVFVKFWTR